MSSRFGDTRLGFEAGRARIWRMPGLVLVVLVVLLGGVAGMLERDVTSAGAVDRTLVAVFSLLIPLSSFAWVGLLTGSRRLTDRALALSRFGASGRAVMLGLSLAAAAAAASSSVAAVAVAVLVTHGHGPTSLWAELFTTSWIAALTAAAYAGWFCLGSTFLWRGRGRWIPLASDFALGTLGFAGLVFPRAHAQNLIGGEAPLALPQAASSGILAALVVVMLGLSSIRARP
jgi:hypothetical protein